MPIETRDEFEKWLAKETKQICAVIASRLALRSLPAATSQSSVTSDKQSRALGAARLTLTAVVSAKILTEKTKAAAQKAADVYATTSAISFDMRSAMAALDVITDVDTGAASRAAFAAAQSAYSAVDAVDGDIDAAESAEEETYAAGLADTKVEPAEIIYVPLWHGGKVPEWWYAANLSSSTLFNPASTWEFWREWYQGFLDGKPMDWELQRRVALIDDTIWEAGPEAVADEIERIRTTFAVEKAADELATGAAHVATSIRGMGDNNPPSPIDEALNSSDGITIIWAAAQTLKEEAQADKPQIGRVAKAIKSLVDVLMSCGYWAAQKVDKGLDAAVVAIGTAGGVAGVAWVTQNGDKIQKLVELAQKWIGLLP